jgi:hypothetical protein
MEFKDSCNPSTCQYHALTEAVVEDLKDAVHRLMEGQDQMKETVIKLVEAFKYMERLDAKIDKLEELHREKERDQDCEIKELKAFMYKIMGVGMILLVAANYVIDKLVL